MAMLRLHEVFTKERIKLGMSSTDKDEAFEELVGFMTGESGGVRQDRILASLRERENKMSTGIKNGIAIPHGKLHGESMIEGVLGVSARGIEYGALDGKPVYLVFLFTSGESMTVEHLAVLKGIAKIAEQPGFIEELRRAESAENANEVIRKYEGP